LGRRDVRRPGRRALGLTASGATCVQKLDGSRDSAIHTKYRISLRSSSMREPRYPLPRVVLFFRRHQLPPSTRVNGARGNMGTQYLKFLGTSRAGVVVLEVHPWPPKGIRAHSRHGRAQRRGIRPPNASPKVKYKFTGRSALQVSTMILPQVHLRKPCYDFSFL
jgi:hypothetical protein